MNSDTRRTLEALKSGEITVDEAMLAIKKEPFADIGYAKVDLHRGIRQGAAEVIYGAGKTAAQMIGIIGVMLKNGVKTILITRLSPESAAKIQEVYPALDYRAGEHIGIYGEMPEPTGLGKIVVATAARPTSPWPRRLRSPQRYTATRLCGSMTWVSRGCTGHWRIWTSS